MQRLLCLAVEKSREMPRDRDDSFFAATMYEAIADISYKVSTLVASQAWGCLCNVADT